MAQRNRKSVESVPEAASTFCLVYRLLEPRMVFDAAGLATLTEAADGPSDAPNLDAAADLAVTALTESLYAQSGPAPSPTGTDPSMPAAAGDAADAGPLAASAGPSIVFVDSRVENYEVIVDHISPGTEIVVIDGETDGLAQIAAHLEGRDQIASVHILSHGSAGSLALGATTLNGDTLLTHQSQLAAIGQALREGGDILIYGCDVGAGAAGGTFVSGLAALTGGDIAASDDLTGSATLGGDWDLETASGSIEAQAIQAGAYAQLLALGAVDDTNTISASATLPVTGNVLTNDTGTGTKTVTQVHGRVSSVGVAYATAYGTITMNANGSYSYSVDTNNATVLGLTGGQSITDIIAYTGVDGTGVADHGYLTITINGVSNPPVADDNFATVTPVGSPTATGNLITDATGGAQPDSIDRPQSLFQWETLYTNGTAVNGTNRTVDGVTVGVTTTAISPGTFTAVTSTATQGGHSGYLAETINPSSLTYTAPTTRFAFSQPVVNLSFGLLDVDNGSPSWQDRVTITATNGAVPVTFQAQYSGWVTRTGDSFFGNNGGVNNTDANGNIVVVFDGPVDNVVITYNDGPGATASDPGSHLIGISDLAWQNPNAATVILANGVVVAAGGTTIAATYGTITVFPSGSYTYTVDPNHPAVIALAPGATLTDVVPYTVRDLLGQTDSAVLNVTVNGINDAPSGTNNVVSLAEDASFTFSAASFGFSDPVDAPSHGLSSVVITSLPAAADGVLTLSGVPVVAGQDIPASQLGSLVFTPAANRNGSGIGTFTFQVRDDGGTANGGANLDATPNTFSFNVAPINDAPVSTAPGAQSVAEDTQLVFSSANGNAITFADLDAGAVGTETVTLTVANGTLILGSTAGLTGLSGNGTATVTFSGTVAQINAAIAGLRYQGSLNFNGSDTLTIQVTDDGRDNGVLASNGAQSAVVRTVAISVSAVNDLPVAGNDSASTAEDTPVTIPASTLLANDGDVDGNTLTITSVQGAVNGTVTLVGGNPVFTPAANFSGTASFTYTVSDGAGGTATATVTITVNPVNDAPAGADATRTISEDDVYTFSAADFPVTDTSDTPAHSLQAVVVTTLPSAADGVLRLSGVAVTAGQVIPAAQLGQLTFTPAGDRNGTGLGAFTFQVRDTGGTANGGIDTDASPNTFQFNVTPVADIVSDVVAALEDTPITFNVLTGAGGPDTFEGTPQVTALTQPANGAVSFAANGTVTFTPAANFNGTTTFTYTVTSGGVTETTTVTLNVAPIDDAPVSTVPSGQTVAEDTQLVFSSANGNAITIADLDAGASGAETVTLTVANGTLILGSTAGLTGLTGNGTSTVTFTGTVAQINAAIAGLRYQGSLNFNGSDTLTISVTDDGRDSGVIAANGPQSAVVRTVPITVTPANDPPLAANDSASTNEDTPVTIPASALLANDSDVDGDTLTITSVQGAVNGTITLVGGNPVFTPAPNYFGPASFTYTVSDGNGGTSTATVNLTIAAVNDAPIAVDDAYATSEDATISIPAATGLLANDTDVDPATSLTVAAINGNSLASGAPITLPSGAELVQNADGTFSYNPNGAFNGLAAGQTATDTFTYRVGDGQGGFGTATAIVTITGVNDPPVAVADTNSTDPRVVVSASAAIGLLSNDTDADTPANQLVVSAVGGSAAFVGQPVAGSNGGTFTINADGSYTFDPGTAFDNLPAGSSATTSITYTMSDGQGDFSTTTLTISVPYQNLPPFVASPPQPQVSQDGNAVSIALAGLFSDPNPAHQGNLTITAAGLPPGLSVDATGTIVGTLTSSASQHAGPYVVTVTATDPSGSQVSTTFDFTVTNPAPVASDDTNSVLEHGATSGTITGNDDDGAADSDTLTVTEINGAAYTPGAAITLPSGARLTMAADGTYSYATNGAFDGLPVGQTATDSFTYRVSDGQGGFATATATITIQGQNDAPVIVDPNNPGIPPSNPNSIIPAQSGQDGTGITPLVVTGYFADPDAGDTLTLSVTGTLPPGITFNPATGTFSGTPSATASQGGPGSNGVYSVLVNASDGNGGVVSTTVTFTIANPAPVASNDSNTVNEHASVTGSVASNDADGGGDTDMLTVASINGQTVVPGATITLPSGALLVMQADGSYSYDPNGAFAALGASQSATDSFTYVIGDGQGGTAMATATIVIQGQNDAPVANSNSNTTSPQVAISVGTGAGVLVNDTDAEGDTLTVTSISNGLGSVTAGSPISGTNGGTFTINADGSYSFDPGTAFDGLPPGASAQTSVTYTISDGQGGTSTTTLTITVPYSNLPPAVQQPLPTQNSQDGAPISIPVGGVFGDPNPGDTLTITAAGLPPGLSFNPVTGAIEGTLTADASQNSGQPYTVTLTAIDPSGSTVTSTFTFNVVNVAPTAGNDTTSVTEHGATTATVIVNDGDGGGDTDSLVVSQVNGVPYTAGSIITLPSGAQLVMNANGAYSYDPNGSFNGLSVGQTATDTFTYQVSDGQGGTATATVTITVTGQNEAPVVVDPSNPGTPPLDPSRVVPVQVGQDGSAIPALDVRPFFADADAADTLALSVVAAQLPPGVTFNPATGTFSGTPSAGASQGGNAGPGVYDVTVTASDGNGGSTSTIVRFTISNPVPIAADDSNSVAEHGTIAGAATVLSNDDDGGSDGDPIAVTQVNGAVVTSGATIALPSGALLVMNSDGSYSYNPNGAFAHLQVGESLVDSFVYQVSDGQGGFDTARVSIVITGENDSPVANLDTNSVPAGGSIATLATLGVLINDTDPEGDALAVTAITNGTTSVAPGIAITGSNGGTFTINADGSYTFDTGSAFDTLLPGTTATTSVTYTISDGMGGTSVTTLTISVPFSHLPPVVNQPVGAQVSTDGIAINLDVSNVFADPNPGDTLTITATGLPPGLTYNPVTGAIEGTLAADASQHAGPYVVVLTAVDQTNNVITSSFQFTVTNPPPVAGNDATSVTEHGTLTGATVMANDADGGSDSDTLTVTAINGGLFTPGTAITLPSGALLTMGAGGTYSFATNGAFDGLGVGQSATDSFTYQISDGQGGTSTATVSITINGQNDMPVVIDPNNPGNPVAPGVQVVPTQSGSDGAPITPLVVTGYFGDPDTIDTLTLSVNPTQLPPGITFDPATGTFSGTADPSASTGGPNGDGTYPVVVTASDGNGGTVSTVVVFQFTNSAPIANPDANTVTETGTITGNVIGNDRDGGQDQDLLTVTMVNGVAANVGQQITLASGALLTLAASGGYTYDTNGQFDGLGVGQSTTDTFTYQVSDGEGGFATTTVTITVIGANDAPVVIDPASPGTPPTDPLHVVPVQTANDGGAITPLVVTGYFADPDAPDTLTLSVNPAQLPPGITFDPATGTFSGTPTSAASQGGPNGDGTYFVTVTASDGNGGTVSTIVTFLLANPPPVATDDSASTGEDSATSGTVLSNDRDGGTDGDVLTVTQVNGSNAAVGQQITLPSGALLTLNADGTYSYDPNGVYGGLGLGQSATDTFTYELSDGQGGVDTATVTITIAGSNDTPVVVDPANPGTPPTDPLHVVPTQTGSDGAAITPLVVTGYFADPDAPDTLTLSVNPTQLPPGITFDPTTGTFSGTADPSASTGGPNGDGTYPVVVTASDGNGGMVTTIVVFQFSNPLPIAGSDANTVTENGTAAGNVLGNDRDGGSDGDTLSVTQVNGSNAAVGQQIALPSGALLTLNSDGTYSYDPNGVYDSLGVGQSATDTFTYQVSDGQGGFDTATVTITITGANAAPVVVDPNNPGTPPTDSMHVAPVQSGTDGAPITPLDVTSYFSDPDTTDTLTLSVNPAQLPPGITFDPATGTFSGTADPSASTGGPNGGGTYPVVVTASDGNGGTVSTIVTFQIANPPPVATDDTGAVTEDGSVSGTVLPNDRDGGSDSDALTVTQVNGSSTAVGQQITLPSGALLTMRADGTFSYDPNGVYDGLGASQSAIDTFTYQVSDGQGGFDTATTTITIQGLNDPPVVINPSNPGTPPADPMHVVPAQTGSDGGPITPLVVTGYFTDPDAPDTLTLSVNPAQLPPGITFDPATGTFSGTPTSVASQGGPNGDGTYPVVVTASDGNGGTVSTLVVFRISNPPPVATDDTGTVTEDGSTSGNVMPNDRDGASDGDALTVTQVNGSSTAVGQQIALSSGARVKLNADGSYSYDPNGAFNGLSVGQFATDTFTYQVSDGQGGLDTATVTITISGENDAPVVVDPSNPGRPPADPQHVVPVRSGVDGTPISPLAVRGYFTDPDASDTLTLSINPSQLPPGITFDPATGTFSGTPGSSASIGGPNGDGVYPVAVTVSDGHGGTVTTIVTFTFSNVPPVAANDFASGTPGDPVRILVLGNDRDGGDDRDALRVVSATPSSGTVSINPDGSLDYRPEPGFAGLITITYVISDGQGGTSTAQALVLITPNVPTSPTPPTIPGSNDMSLPLNTGIDATGAVLSAVHNVEPLNATAPQDGTRGVSATGIVVATANGISPLGSTASVDPRVLNPVWRLQSMIERDFNRASDTWAPEGLTGFSLRYTFATDQIGDSKAQIVLESLVRDRTLIVNLSSTALATHAQVVEYRVMMTDGRPLPAWLDRAGPQVLIGERPVDVEAIRLRVVAVLSDGSSVIRDVEIQTMSGEIKQVVEKQATLVPLFDEQLQQEKSVEDDFSGLLRALEAR